MKTLIFNGSPRKNGDTRSLIHELMNQLQGQVKIVNAYDCNISPCLDCRYCWQEDGCSIEDDMQEVYDYIQVCDNIIIASPLYFSEISGQLLSILSRLQTYFASSHFRKNPPIEKQKKGGVILVGGGDGKMDKAYETACILLKHMHARPLDIKIFSHNTNRLPAIEDRQVLEKIKDLAQRMKED